MASIAVPAGQSGTIIPLEVVPATDGSGTYVLVVSLQDPNIDIGTVDVALTYNHNPPVLNDGQTTGFQSDINGNLKATLVPPFGSSAVGGVYTTPTDSALYSITPGSSSRLETSHVIKSTGGNLYELYVVTGTVGGYLMTFNATHVPDDGPVTPVESVPVAPNSFVTIRAGGSPPDHYSNGIVAVFSTTGPLIKSTTTPYGRGLYGHGRFTGTPSAFFKWSVV